MSGSPSLWAASKDCCVPRRPHPGRGLEEKEWGAGEEEGERGPPRPEDQLWPLRLPVSLQSRVFSPRRSPHCPGHHLFPPESQVLPREAWRSAEFPRECRAPLQGRPAPSSALPLLTCPLPGFASSSHLTWAGCWSPPITTHSRWGAARKQSPSEAPGPRIRRAWTSAGGKRPPE